MHLIWFTKEIVGDCFYILQKYIQLVYKKRLQCNKFNKHTAFIILVFGTFQSRSKLIQNCVASVVDHLTNKYFLVCTGVV